jgi:hypothetical protein
MSLPQRIAAYLAILAFGAPSVIIALVGGEVWPFLDYRMYAEAKLTPEVDWLELVGRTADGRIFPLDDEQYIVPFTYSELLRALDALDVAGEIDPSPARRALRGLLNAYEMQRRAGEHDGPPLAALEVYQVNWMARPGADNYATPASRTLLQSAALSESLQ